MPSIRRPIGRMIYIHPQFIQRRQFHQIAPIGVRNIKAAATAVVYGRYGDAASVRRRPRQRPVKSVYEHLRGRKGCVWAYDNQLTRPMHGVDVPNGHCLWYRTGVGCRGDRQGWLQHYNCAE